MDTKFVLRTLRVLKKLAKTAYQITGLPIYFCKLGLGISPPDMISTIHAIAFCLYVLIDKAPEAVAQFRAVRRFVQNWWRPPD